MKILNSSDAKFSQQLDQLLVRQSEQSADIDKTVGEILKTVKTQGDKALLAYTEQFDGLSADCVSDLEVPQNDLQLALECIDPDLKQALEFAARRIETYHLHQLQQNWSFVDDHGAELGQRITALDKVGLYVPGGKAAYPSSVLMSAIPAKVAGVGELIMTVPAPNNDLNRNVLAAAAIAGVDRVFKIGGAQAIAALAYGTQTIPKVDKIVGPGNAYVAAAKRMVFGEVGIDMIAGPSEVLVVSDASVDPEWVAVDLFAQAEHDEMAQSIHITADADHHAEVVKAVERLLPNQPRQQIIRESLAARGACILADHDKTIVDLANRIAPEHLELLSADAEELLAGIRHAGAIFIGSYSAEALGDYCAGPNHVLPTSGTARFSSPLGVYDFQKRSSVIRFNKASATTVAKNAAVIAASEGLPAHQQSANYRADSKDGQ